MRALVLALIAVVSCAAPPSALPTPSPTPEPGILTVAALLDLSGPRSALGTQQRNALQLWVDQPTQAVPVRLRTVDVGGSDAKALIELRRAATDASVDAVIVGVPVTYDDTFGRAVEVAALPVLLTLPIASDPARRPGASWAFALAPTLGTIAKSEVEDAMRRGVAVPSVLLTEPRDRVDAMANALTLEIDRHAIGGATSVALTTDGALPQGLRFLDPPRSVHCTVAVAPCAALADVARSGGAQPMFYLSYLTTPADLSDRKELAFRAMIPGPSAPFAGPFGKGGDTAAGAFLRAFGDRFGPAGTHAVTAYDALTLLSAAATSAGADDRAALRDALVSARVRLLTGSYSFAPDRRVGPDASELGYLRWDGATFTPAFSPPIRLR